MATAPRLPLKETTGNSIVRIPRKQQQQPEQQQQNQPAATRGGGEYESKKRREPNQEVAEYQELKEWRRTWRKIMAQSVFFFDSVDKIHISRLEGAMAALGTTIDPFFSVKVTNVVTSRSTDAELYPPGDVLNKASAEGMKIWSYEKLMRFLNNLLDSSPVNYIKRTNQNPSTNAVVSTRHTGNNNKTTRDQQLDTILRQEKLNGPNDRDPTAKRDDYHYFRGPYLLVWDPSQNYRPIIHKEFNPKATRPEDSWPQLRWKSIPRQSPFVADSDHSSHNNSRYHQTPYHPAVSLKRKREDNQGMNGGGPIIYSQQQHSNATVSKPQQSNNTARLPMKPLPAAPPANPSSQQYQQDRSYEIAASGILKSTSAVKSVIQSTGTDQQSGNGLGAPGTQVASKELNHLKKRVLSSKVVAPVPQQQQVCEVSKKPTATTNENQKKRPSKESKSEDDSKPGYCENCQAKYDRFVDHINSKKHVKFAANDSNFVELDNLLHDLMRPKREQQVVLIN